jgi:hypothetical protein
MTESVVTTGPARRPHLQRWTILGLLGVAQLMLIPDVTVVAIALPRMGADLGLGRETLSWVVSGYTAGASADGFTRGFTSGAVAAAAAALMALVLTPGHRAT